MPKYLRMTVDVALFDGEESIYKELTRSSEKSRQADGDGKGEIVERFYTFGTGEHLARRFMERIQRGGIEIDEIASIEEHGGELDGGG